MAVKGCGHQSEVPVSVTSSDRLIFDRTGFFSGLFLLFRLKFISLPPIYHHDRSNTLISVLKEPNVNDKPSSDPSSEAPNEQQANEPVSPETDANNAAVSGEQDESLATDSDDEDQSRSDAGAENSLEAQLEALSAQLSNAKDEQLRTQAEMQNLRRRAERDVEKAHKFGLEKLINGLLPVLDNFDRAIAAVPEAAADDEVVKSLLEGVELTRKTALDVLKTFSVEVLEPYGEPFNPEFHQAMTMVPSPTAEPNSVIDVLQKGYTLNGRLLRAAMVVIAKAEEA
ncbi:MAG: nucleotide exchange factor GrpE [Cellvibrionales bacterium]|nr:nucleotide exchange factor GrpE [Cellvibrionales bacterium]